jgi:hypothetical protein
MLLGTINISGYDLQMAKLSFLIAVNFSDISMFSPYLSSSLIGSLYISQPSIKSLFS